MIRSVIYFFLLSTLFIGQAAGNEPMAEVASARVLNFDVFLNDREVGHHRFELLEQGESIEVSSTMSLDFKVFKIKRVQVQTSGQRNLAIWLSGGATERNRKAR